MPIAPKPPIPRHGARRAVIQLKGPKDTELIKRFNKELKKVAKKYGATLKRPATGRRKKRRAKRKR